MQFVGRATAKGNIMKRIYRSSSESKIAGVCGGIGLMWNIDPTFVRLAAVFLCFTPAVAAVVVTYMTAWAIVPIKPQED